MRCILTVLLLKKTCEAIFWGNVVCRAVAGIFEPFLKSTEGAETLETRKKEQPHSGSKLSSDYH